MRLSYKRVEECDFFLDEDEGGDDEEHLGICSPARFAEVRRSWLQSDEGDSLECLQAEDRFTLAPVFLFRCRVRWDAPRSKMALLSRAQWLLEAAYHFRGNARAPLIVCLDEGVNLDDEGDVVGRVWRASLDLRAHGALRRLASSSRILFSRFLRETGTAMMLQYDEATFGNLLGPVPAPNVESALDERRELHRQLQAKKQREVYKPKSTQVCRFFLKGQCRKGALCKRLHPELETKK